jgi:hypothetical protein
VRQRIVIIVAAVVLVAGVATAWILEARTAPKNPVPAAAAAAYRVRVVQNGKDLASFDLAALEAVGMKTVVAQGQPQQGPSLLAVLRKAGVGDGFTQVTVIGMGIRDSGRLVLKRSQIGENDVLAVAQKRDTVKIAGPDVPQDMRIRDVVELVVQ